jgi:signal transduction histidine kinase
MPLHPWLNLTDYSAAQLIPAFIGSLSWVIVYLLLIRNAHRNEFVEMPFFIACGNIAWEFLYGFVFCQYVNMGQIFIWGNRVWFLLDVYIIFVLIFRYGQKQVITPLLRQYFKFVIVATVLAFTALLYALVTSGLDNAPLWSSGLVRLGGISAYLLNIGISTLYIALYLRLYRTESFSSATAWLKMLGTAMFTVFFWQIDPHNYFLQTLAVVVSVLDVSYIILQYTLPNNVVSEPRAIKTNTVKANTIKASETGTNAFTTLTDAHGRTYRFPLNPAFEKAWEALPTKEYIELHGLKLRKILKPDWVVDLPNYHDTHSVLEGANIVLHTQHGFGTGEGTNAICAVMIDIIQAMGLRTQPHIVLTDTLGSTGANADARRRTIEFFREMAGLPQHRIVVVSTLARIALKLIQPFSPMIRSWSLVDSFDHAAREVLEHFVATPPQAVATLKDGLNDEQNSKQNTGEAARHSTSTDYHQQRLQQVYFGLAKISDNDLDGFEPVEVPSDDVYSDVFTALDVIAREKRIQIASLRDANQALQDSNEEILRQQQILVEQARDIELANAKLQEQNEEMTRLIGELNTANLFKTQVLSIAAHDLKNPLGTIMGLTEVLQSELVLDEQPRTWLANILSTADRMSNLIKDLLDSAAIELGNITLEIENVSLSLLVVSIVERYHTRIEQKSQHVELAVADNILCRGDQDRLEQVFDNLVSNAVKYAPHNSTITVRIQQTGSLARVEVQDEGPGINEEDKQKMFGFFQRLSAIPTGGESSNGVGLAIVKNIVDLHGGKIWCESEIGKGATFIVELPIASPHSA